MTEARRYRAGDSVEDYCRACKLLRRHAVMAAGMDGTIIRVVCGYCDSQHHYRRGAAPVVKGVPAASGAERGSLPGTGTAHPPFEGGSQAGRRGDPSRPMTGQSSPRPMQGAGSPQAASGTADAERRLSGAGRSVWTWPLVTERERRYPMVNPESPDGQPADLEMMLRRVLREEMGLGPVAPADKWRDGEMILRPGRAGLQEKTWPIETFFHKVVMLRNRLRVLEQQINGADVPADLKIKLQGYITACYGSLTSFNVLFAEEEDRFRGSGGSEE